MHYNRISCSLTCNKSVTDALRDALKIKASDFVREDTIILSTAFTAHFPATREGEPLSGLWDHFDPSALGYRRLEWREPGVEVDWWKDCAVLTGRRACMERVIDIVRHVCRDTLPVILEWVAEDHHRRPEDTVSKCALIGLEEVLIESSAEIARRWRLATMRSVNIDLEHESNDSDASPYFDVFLAEEISLEQCLDRFAGPLHEALTAAGVGKVIQSGDSSTSEFLEGDGELCSEIVAIASDVAAALYISREVLAERGLRIGGQLQYEFGAKLLFETFTASGWAKPVIASVIDNGRAYASDVWSGGTPQ